MGLLGGFLLMLVLALAFFTPREPGMEEAGVYNAVYTWTTTGRMSFPIYGLYDSFGIHPHTHYFMLGVLMRLGADLYLAEAIPVSIMALVATALLLTADFSPPIKVGGLLGMYSTIVIATFVLPDHAFAVRPELTLPVTWFAGLIALESGRRAGWDLPRLLLGAFLVTAASGMQNYASLGFLGLGVYVIWVLFALPLRRSLARIGAIVVGGCLFGVPYVVYYVMPNLEMIKSNIGWGTTHAADINSKLANYLDVYRTLLPGLQQRLGSDLVTAGPLILFLKLGVPLFVVAAVIYFAVPELRGMSLAALPVPALVIWISPEAQYLLSETLFFLAAFWIAVLIGVYWLAKRLFGRAWLRAGAWTLVTLVVALAAFSGSLRLRDSTLQFHPPNEMDVARAAGQAILGRDASIASRQLAWYTSGAAEWYNLEKVLTQPKDASNFDAGLFLRQFSAGADYALFSDSTESGQTLSSIYARGGLQLRGFYFGQRFAGLSYLLFRGADSGAFEGYALQNDALYHFNEQPSGQDEFLTIEHPTTQVPPTGGARLYSLYLMNLPHPGNSPIVSSISAVVVPRQLTDAYLAELPSSDRILDRIPGEVSVANLDALLSNLRHEDKPIEFLRGPEQDRLRVFTENAAPLQPNLDTNNYPPKGWVEASGGTPISSGSYAFVPGMLPDSAFDRDDNTAWASNLLGADVVWQAYVGKDFGPGNSRSIRGFATKQGVNNDSTVASAILQYSDDGYAWTPVALAPLHRNFDWMQFVTPPVGAHRFWALWANDQPAANHSWGVAEFRLFEAPDL